MITLNTVKGKYFFSSFVLVVGETQLEESLLTLADLRYLIMAIETNRLETSEEDLVILKNALEMKGASGGGVDVGSLNSKEDKLNKVSGIGVGSDVKYPTTNAVKTFIEEKVDGLVTEEELLNAVSSSGSTWELVNATVVGGLLTYTGGIYTNHEHSYAGFHAKKFIDIGETVTIDFYYEPSKVTGLVLAVDTGVEDSYSSVVSYAEISASIRKHLSSVLLTTQRDWNEEFLVQMEDDFRCRASISRVESDKVILTLLDSSGVVLSTREVLIPGFELDNIWFSASFVNENVSYSNRINIVLPKYVTQLELESKVSKELGKGLSTNDFTDLDKESIQKIREYEVRDSTFSTTNVSMEVEESGKVVYTLNTRPVAHQMFVRKSADMVPETVETLPVYVLGNDGKYLLTEPDAWVSFMDSNYVFPVYHKSTLSPSNLRGNVIFYATLQSDSIYVEYEHNIKGIIDDYRFQLNLTSFYVSNDILQQMFESSSEGEYKTGSFSIPLNIERNGMTLEQSIDVTDPNLYIELIFKAGNKETISTYQRGFYTNQS